VKQENQLLRLLLLFLVAVTIFLTMRQAGHSLYRPSNDYAAYLAQPEQYAGRLLYLNSAPLLELGKGYFLVRDGRTRLYVKGDLPDGKEGGRLSLELRFHADGSLSLVSSYYHALRPLKIAVSLGAALFCLFCFLGAFRLDARAGYLVPR
jgi:hypothetical protein